MFAVAGSNPTPASFSFQLLFNFFSIFFLNFSYNYGCIGRLLALFSFFISKYCKKHNVTCVISTTCHSEASEITSSHRSGRILVIALSNMFAVILLKKRAKYLLEFLNQVQRHVVMRILNVDPVYSESDKEYI